MGLKKSMKRKGKGKLVPGSRPLRPLSAEAMEARRLPHPTLLLQAEQDRPDLQTRARVARAVRVPKSDVAMTMIARWQAGASGDVAAALGALGEAMARSQGPHDGIGDGMADAAPQHLRQDW